MKCGIDIGGTKVLGLAFDDDPIESVASRVAPTIYDAAAIIATIAAVVSDLEVDSGSRLETIGIGIAGIVDRTGTLRYSPNIPGVVDFHLSEIAGERLGRRVIVENDAAAATWAEHRVGAAIGVENMAFVGLGTGIGTGFVLDGRLHHGWHGFSGESGHMIIDKTGPTHLTGADGPWELTASGSGLARLARRRAEENRLETVVGLAGSVEGIEGRHVQEASESGAADVIDLLDEFAREVAIGLANLIHMLDLEVILIGGGLADLGNPLIDPIRRHTASLVLGGEHRSPTTIKAAGLGARSGAIGAALLAEEASIG